MRLAPGDPALQRRRPRPTVGRVARPRDVTVGAQQHRRTGVDPLGLQQLDVDRGSAVFTYEDEAGVHLLQLSDPAVGQGNLRPAGAHQRALTAATCAPQCRSREAAGDRVTHAGDTKEFGCQPVSGWVVLWTLWIVIGLLKAGIIIALSIFLGGVTLVIWSAIKIRKYIRTISRVDADAGRIR